MTDSQAYIDRHGRPVTLPGGATLRAIKGRSEPVTGASPQMGTDDANMTPVAWTFGPDCIGKLRRNGTFVEEVPGLEPVEYQVKVIDPNMSGDLVISVNVVTDPIG